MASLDRQSQIAYRLMYMISAVLITVSFFLSTVEDLINGMLRITFASDILITDYMEIAGVGAAFFNAGCVTLITLLLMRLCKLPMHGNGISTASLMAGFSFFGKNIVNMWFMLPGTILYAHIRKEPLSKYLTFSLMSTSLGPLISSLLFANGFSGKSFLLALLTGTVIGFVAPPLCIHTNTLLHGLNLYNGGFAIGLLAMVLGSIFKCFGYTFEAQMYWYTGHNMELAIGLYLIAAGTVLYGLYHDSAHILRRYRMLLRHPGVPGHDFIELDGMGAVCMNIGVNLAFSVTLLLLVGGDLNGATIGALLTIAGFSAKGKHVGNIAPVMFGVLISVAVTGRALSPASPAGTAVLHHPGAGGGHLRHRRRTGRRIPALLRGTVRRRRILGIEPVQQRFRRRHRLHRAVCGAVRIFKAQHLLRALRHPGRRTRHSREPVHPRGAGR